MKKLVNGIIEDCTEEEILEYENLKTNETNNFNVSIENLRFKRNNLLKQSDWTVLPDSPITNKTDWQTYRTNLRNLTNGLSTADDVDAVEFPTKPNQE